MLRVGLALASFGSVSALYGIALTRVAEVTSVQPDVKDNPVLLAGLEVDRKSGVLFRRVGVVVALTGLAILGVTAVWNLVGD